jgi:hypothetical protein
MNSTLINLSIISKIKPNDKIYMNNDNFISIEYDSFLQGILRFVFNNSRVKNMNYLNNFYTSVYAYIDELINSKYLTNNINCDHENENYTNAYNNLKEINQYIKASIHGLENLKQTYSPDIVTISKIDIIISKIETYIERIEKKLDNLTL